MLGNRERRRQRQSVSDRFRMRSRLPQIPDVQERKERALRRDRQRHVGTNAEHVMLVVVEIGVDRASSWQRVRTKPVGRELTLGVVRCPEHDAAAEIRFPERVLERQDDLADTDTRVLLVAVDFLVRRGRQADRLRLVEQERCPDERLVSHLPFRLLLLPLNWYVPVGA